MNINKHKISLKNVKFFLSLISFFSVLKFLVFVSPLLLNEIVSLNLYGEFEYSFNLGQTIVGVFSMGLVSSYAYFTLTKDQKQKTPIIHMHFLVISLAVLLIALTNLSLLSNILFGSINGCNGCVTNEFLSK